MVALATFPDVTEPMVSTFAGPIAPVAPVSPLLPCGMPSASVPVDLS